MKKLMLAAIVAVLSACGPGVNSPRGVAANFTESVAHGKIEQAKQLATESTARLLDYGNMPGMKIDPNFKFRFVRDSVADNQAWVYFMDASDSVESLYLVKLDGKWKVHMEFKK